MATDDSCKWQLMIHYQLKRGTTQASAEKDHPGQEPRKNIKGKSRRSQIESRMKAKYERESVGVWA